MNDNAEIEIAETDAIRDASGRLVGMTTRKRIVRDAQSAERIAMLTAALGEALILFDRERRARAAANAELVELRGRLAELQKVEDARSIEQRKGDRQRWER